MLTFLLVDTRRVYSWVFGIYVPIGLGVFVLFTAAIIGTVLWFRLHPPARAARWHEANTLEISYALVLTCVAAFLLYVTFHAEHRLDSPASYERPAMTIDVTGSRWEWTYRYPSYGITRQSGLVGHQPLVVPINEAIRFRLTSDDVIHSFWIPQLAFKRDAIPGQTETVMLDFDKAGTFSGACAEYCGLYHAEMVFTVDAVTPSAFQRWARSGGRAAA